MCCRQIRQIGGRWSKVLAVLAVAGWLGATGIARATTTEDLVADSVSGTNGTAIATWTAATGNNGVTPGAGHGALIENGVLNGHNVLSFGGTRSPDYWTGYSVVPPGGVTVSGRTAGTTWVVQPFSIFTVVQINGDDSTNPGDTVLDGISTAERVSFAVNPSGSNYNAVGIGNDAAGSNMLSFSGAVQKSAWQQWNVWELDYNGASSAIYRNGQLVTTGSLAGGLGIRTDTGKGLYLGLDLNGLYALNGEMAEFAILTSPSSSDLTNETSALLTKYCARARWPSRRSRRER